MPKLQVEMSDDEEEEKHGGLKRERRTTEKVKPESRVS